MEQRIDFFEDHFDEENNDDDDGLDDVSDELDYL